MYRFLIILIIILLLFVFRKRSVKKYSWEDFQNRFSNTNGIVKIYDTDKIDKEQNFGCTKIQTTYDEIFTKKYSTPKMVKIYEDNCDEENSKLIDYCRPLTHGYEKYRGVTLRIQTSPWLYNSHFDGFDQAVITLHGHKRWLFFNLDKHFDTIEKERKFIKMIAGKNIDDVITHFIEPMGISYEIKDTRSGDHIRIPMGLYHLTESSETSGCIILNIPISKDDPELTRKFEELWPDWYTKGGTE
jgi:hypothetical protein